MTYKLLNRTYIPRDIVDAMIQFSCPKGVEDFKISIINSNKNFDGTAGQTFTDKKHVMVWIGNPEYPSLINDKIVEKMGYKPNFMVYNQEEDLISTIAHELRHLWQFTVSKQNFFTGPFHNYKHWDNNEYICVVKMESDACKYSYKILKEFRKQMKIV